MTNAMANGVWRKALKKLVSSVCVVLIINFSDPKGVVFSKEWLGHVLFAMVVLVVFTEAQYWKDWADSPNGDDNVHKGNGSSNFGGGISGS